VVINARREGKIEVGDKRVAVKDFGEEIGAQWAEKSAVARLDGVEEFTGKRE